eukprot:4880982-Alexandrium_andersonii.AAC.1
MRAKITQQAITDIKPIFAPMAKVLLIKHRDMVAAVKACGSFQSWLGKRNVDASEAGAAADQEEGHELHEELDNNFNKWNAFEDKGDQQGQFIRAADYDDN